MALALFALAAGCGGGDGGKTSQQTVAGTTQEAAAEQHAARVTKVQQLIPIARQSQAGKSRKEQIRISTAEFQLGQIAGKDVSAVRPLLLALKRRDYELIARLSGFYIALGKPGSEPILAETVGRLYSTGNTEYVGLPFEFLGAGNPKLERAVIDELASKGYTVTGHGGPVTPGLKWGSSGAYK